MKKGAVTAFLSLIFILLMSVVASLVESASIQVMKNRKRGDMERAMESIFAEYQRELLEEFEVFSLEGTYGTGTFEEKNLTDRLDFYGMRNTKHHVEKIQFLTDESGRPFREQVLAYMKNKIGISELEELSGMTGEWKEQAGKTEQYEQEESNAEKHLTESLQKEEQALPEEDNPIQVIASIKKAGLINIVMKGKEVSDKVVEAKGMLTNRSLNSGKGEFKVRGDTEGVTSNLYFTSYLLEKFHGADDGFGEGKLSYELEYIINGGVSDRENLEAVLRKISAIRLPINYAYLLTDEGKKAEAGAMAAALAGLIALPALTEMIRQGILFAWAFGESIMDLRTLLSGGRVSLTKTREEWQLSLSGLLKLGTEEDGGAGKRGEQGLCYKDYLRMLLTFQNADLCTMRSLGALEMRLQNKLGEWFQVDHCISKLNVRENCSLRRNIYYEFATEYGYQ